MRYIFIIMVMAFACGCVSFGAQCAKNDTQAHYKVTRFGWGVSAKQVENLAQFKARVCPGY